MKIFKASLSLLAFAFLLMSCKPQQAATVQQKPAEKAAVAAAMKELPVIKKDTAFSVFSVDMARKTVYRGMKNPLTIVVPNAISIKAEANGLMKVDDFGHYDIRPGMGTKAEIKITATMPNGTTFTETRILKIMNIPNPKVYILESLGTGATITEEQLKKAEISMVMDNFDYDLEWAVTGFDVLYPNGKKVKVKGNKFDAKALELLEKVKHNASITIYNVTGESIPQTAILFRPDPITIKVNKKARQKK